MLLIYSNAPLNLWAHALPTACFTKNRSIIHTIYNKTSYEVINGKKPNISFLHVFRALCYPYNDREDLGKFKAKGDIGFFVGYSKIGRGYKIYNRRTKKVMETMNVKFDELSKISRHISSGLLLNQASPTITLDKPFECDLDHFFEMMYGDYMGDQPDAQITAPTTPL
ncbi:retrovirus-related pol polyprotein from transposon TNT 1-94 [Tanacetum coccineum]|uniref:Retrovirus-related pol polyprotein from transposon TNT 1-94 n=1 Tax=Tanacetum coccineum TaxID=301880 RepID=A0ABQ5C3I7_9ASTR